MMDDREIDLIVNEVIKELIAAGTVTDGFSAQVSQSRESSQATVELFSSKQSSTNIQRNQAEISIDLPDPAQEINRYQPRVKNPKDKAALKELIASTSARIGVGRSGPRYNTASLLLFQGDHAITQDSLYREVDQHLLDELGLFTVQTRISVDKEEFLLRPDLGRQLSEDAKKSIAEKCVKNPNIQIVIGDGLSSAAIEANLRQIYPVLKQGFQTAGLTVGTPFYIKYCRVGVMNDVGEVIQPDIVILLIGERPGLGRADSMSAYMGYKPKYGHNDADRDVICNIFENGGTNPLEAGAFIVQFAQKMMHHQASGVKLKLAAK